MRTTGTAGFREMGNDGSATAYRIESWGDLLGAPAQGALSRCHRGVSRIECTCRQGEQIWPPLTARLRSDYFSCLRLRVREHAVDCIFRALYGDEPEKPYSPSIFTPPSEAVQQTHSDNANSHTERAESEFFHLTYSRFCERAVAAATTESFLAANIDTPTQPTGTQFFRALEADFRQTRFPGPADAFAAALGQGTMLRFGVTVSPPQLAAAGETLLNVAAWSDPSLQMETWLIPSHLLEGGLEHLRGLNSLVSPPWLVIAAVEPDGRVRRIWLQGVWSDGVHLTTAESDYERLAPPFLRSQGEVFFKPVLRDDVPDFLSRLGHIEAGSIAWRHIPDYVCWRGMDSVVTARIVELRGFRPGTNADYDKNMDGKLKHFRALGERWQVEEISGWDIPAQPRCILSSTDWKSPPILPGGLSPAAHAWICRSLNPNSSHNPPQVR